MKKGLILKNHSFVDVITNSSTELFVGNTEKTVSFVEEVLMDYLTVYYKHNESYRWDGTLGSICTVDIICEENLDEWIERLTGWDLPYWVETDGRQPQYNYFSDWKEYEKADDEWLAKNLEAIKKGIIGIVTIMGAGDNDIPYELYGVIEGIFEKNSHRIHMG